MVAAAVNVCSVVVCVHACRYNVHVAAEAYGLAHASHSEAGDRVIKVWKVSRTRKAYGGGGYVSDDGSD